MKRLPKIDCDGNCNSVKGLTGVVCDGNCNSVKGLTKVVCDGNCSGLRDLVVVGVLVVYASIAISAFWQRPYLLTLLLIPPPLVLAKMFGDIRRSLAFSILGALIGPVTESICVANGLWTYANTGGLPLIPPWNFLIWTSFAPAIWIVLRSFTGKPTPKIVIPLHIASAGLVLEICIFVIFGKNSLYAAPLALLLVFMSLIFVRDVSTAIIMAAGALLGPVCESLPIAFGAWRYSLSEIFGMPAWLPIGYAIFALLVSHIVLGITSCKMPFKYTRLYQNVSKHLLSLNIRPKP